MGYNAPLMISGRPQVNRLVELSLYLLLVLIVCLRTTQMFYDGAVCIHLPCIAQRMAAWDDGRLWFQGNQLGMTGIYPYGPFFYWLYLPLRLISNPALAITLHQAAWEVAVVCLFVFVGRRRFQDPALAWSGGLLLAACLETKVDFCENNIAAARLLTLLFVALLWALSRPSLRAWLLPGVLFGLACQMHVTALVMAPGLLLVLWMARRQFWPRLAVGALCWVAITLGALINREIVLPGNHAGLQAWALGLGRLQAYLLNLAEYPYWTLGMALVGLRWFRRRAGPEERVALLLVPGGLLLLGLAMDLYGPVSDPRRFTVFGASRAVLAGGVLAFALRAVVWSLDRSDRWPVEILLPLLLVTAGVAGYSALQAHQARARFQAAVQRDPRATCDPLLTQSYESVAQLDRLHRALAGRRLPATWRELFSPAEAMISAALYWSRGRDRHHEAAMLRRGPPPPSLVLLPKVAGFDLTRLARAVDFDRFVAAPGYLSRKELHVTDPSKPTFQLPLHLPEGKERAVLLVLLSPHAGRTPETPCHPAVSQGETRFHYMGGCASGGQSFFLYDLAPLRGSRVTLDLGCWREGTRFFTYATLPEPPGVPPGQGRAARPGGAGR